MNKKQLWIFIILVINLEEFKSDNNTDIISQIIFHLSTVCLSI